MHDARGNLLRFDGAAPGEGAFEVLGTAIDGLRLSVPQQG